MKTFGLGSWAIGAMGILAAVFAGSLILGCEDTTEVQTPAVSLSDAKVSVAGQSLGGLTIHPGEYEGPVRYEARLVDAQGHPVSGHRVRVRVEVPMMGGMHPRMDEFHCYDDGTHGDPMPGDGIYCYEDGQHDYGCHRADAQPGAYHYDFCGVDTQGHESNHVQVNVTLQ